MQRAGPAPFADAIGVEPAGGGRYTALLGPLWTVGPKAHGGLLLVLLVRAGLARLAADGAAAPDPGPVELRTEVLKTGRTASVVAVRMDQGGRAVLAASVTAGRLPDGAPSWSALPDLPAEPPPDALDPAAAPGSPFGVASACDLRSDAATMPFLTGEPGEPRMRGWARPRGEETGVLFALLAGDILPPAVFNLGGRAGWAPTVQLTALLRARPAPGWLRLESRSTVVDGTWFDEDAVVVDSAGRLVCQARQLALAPLARG